MAGEHRVASRARAARAGVFVPGVPALGQLPQGDALCPDQAQARHQRLPRADGALSRHGDADRQPLRAHEVYLSERGIFLRQALLGRAARCGQIRRRAAGAAGRARAREKGEGENAPRRISPPGQARKAAQGAEARAAEEKTPRPRGGDHRRRARRLPDRGRHRRPLHGPALPLHGQDRRGADARGRHGRPVPEPAARAGRARLCRQARGRAHGRGPQGPHGAVRLRRPVLVRRPAAGRGRGGRRRRDGGGHRPVRPERHRAPRRHP